MRTNLRSLATTLSFVQLAALLLCLSSAGSAQLIVSGYQGSSAQLTADGTYSVYLPGSGWQLSGALGVRPANSHTSLGTDTLGDYAELGFDYAIGASHQSGSVRAYANRPIMLFSVTYNTAAANANPFPVFTTSPAGLMHMTYSGMFAGPSFSGFAPDSPWVFFDGSANAMILSAASNFMAAATSYGADNRIQTGISGAIANLPAGFTHRTALAFGQGITATIDAWGRALTDLTGKTRPANDSGELLRRVSYWTDNGATYYYNPGPSTYTDTLSAIAQEFNGKGIGLGSIQLDSWWYPKGPDTAWRSTGGIWAYSASPGILPAELTGLRNSVGVPLTTHARWIDAGSPYRAQYTISGNVATDPRYWEDIATYLQASGVTTYEQDWLGQNAEAALNLTDPLAFLDNMSASMAKRGIAMQYCMAMPNHFLQSTRYSNLTTIRASQDRFGPTRWNNFLYVSEFAGALGILPFSDVFMSGERDNLLLATLSAGPVGVGDPIGAISAADLLQSVRADGVIVKPDVPAAPVDSVYIADAQGIDSPMVASTWSDFAGARANYIVAFTRGSNTAISIRPADYGIAGQAWLYDYLNGTGTLIQPDSAATVNLNGTGYFVLAAVGKSGIAFLGDRGQFVTLGKARIPAYSDQGRVEASISFAPGETARTLFGYSPHPVKAIASGARIGNVTWDASTRMFSIEVDTRGSGTARVAIASSFGALIAPRP